MFALGDGVMHAHMSEIAPATYKKAHRHAAGTHVLTLTGGGYSLLWYPGDARLHARRLGVRHVFPPLQGAVPPALRHERTSLALRRYRHRRRPLSLHRAEAAHGWRTTVRNASQISVKEGGDQIEYEDQDPRIHPMWLEEMRKHGITPRLELPKT